MKKGLLLAGPKRRFRLGFTGVLHSTGVEPVTLGSEDRCSIQLSYECGTCLWGGDYHCRGDKIQPVAAWCFSEPSASHGCHARVLTFRLGTFDLGHQLLRRLILHRRQC